MNSRKSRINIPLAAWLLIFFMTVMCLTSCGERSDHAGEEKTRVVVDCIGRQVMVPDKIQRVGCLYAFAGHVTALLGEEDKMVAVVNGLKRDKLLTGMFPDLLNKPVPFSQDHINIEALAKLDPDVVLIRETTAKNPAEMEKLEAFGIPVLVVDSNTIEEQRASVLMVGELFGGAALEQAKKYDSFFEDAVEAAKEKANHINPDKRITVYHSINEATRTDSAGTLPAEWTELVGVENVSAEEPLSLFEGKTYAGLEQIYRWDPKVIICNEPGVSEYILTDGKWKGLRAVKNKEVYQMPIAVSRWGHPGSVETPLAIYWLGKLVYPEIYSDVDLIGKTREFYQTFFHYELSNEEIDRILSGEGMRKEKSE